MNQNASAGCIGVATLVLTLGLWSEGSCRRAGDAHILGLANWSVDVIGRLMLTNSSEGLSKEPKKLANEYARSDCKRAKH